MMKNSGIWAVMPIKRFEEAKFRLSAVLTGDEREGLSRAMMSDVLTALSKAPRISGILVVTRDPAAKKISESAAAHVLEESRDWGHNGSVMKAASLLQAAGCRGIICVPGDVPLVTPAEIENILKLHGDIHAVTLSPSLDGKGTNGIVCSPADAIPLCYGENSFPAHLATARLCGFEPEIIKLPGLALDIDFPDDLMAFIQKKSDTLTAQYLAQSGIAKRLLNNIPVCDNLGVG